MTMSERFKCQQCPYETSSVHRAELHEFRNEGHDVWEIEKGSDDDHE